MAEMCFFELKSKMAASGHIENVMHNCSTFRCRNKRNASIPYDSGVLNLFMVFILL